MKPQRIQRQRTKGWRMPPNTVSVTRPGPFGNPFYPGCGLGYGNIDDQGRPVEWPRRTPEDMVRHFRERMRLIYKHEPRRFFAEFVMPLRGKNLACWCKPGAPCHADVLLELVNVDRRKAAA